MNRALEVVFYKKEENIISKNKNTNTNQQRRQKKLCMWIDRLALTESTRPTSRYSGYSGTRSEVVHWYSYLYMHPLPYTISI